MRVHDYELKSCMMYIDRIIKQGFIKTKYLFLTIVSLRVLIKSTTAQIHKLLVEFGFFMIPPAPIGSGVVNGRFFDHIVHVVLIFEFTGMFPGQKSGFFTAGKFQQNQFIFVDPRNQISFDFFSDDVFLMLQQDINCCAWHY